MREVLFGREEAGAIFGSIRKDFRIFAPVEKDGAGRFSDANIVTYDFVESFDEIAFFKKTYFSAKDSVFPIRETLFKYRGNSILEAETGITPTIVFLRSCDIHALNVTDTHFLKDSSTKDTYYQRRREKLKVFLLECKDPFENCFCVSMGTNRTGDYAVFMRKTEKGFEVRIKDEKLERYFLGGEEAEVEPQFVREDLQPVKIPEEVDLSLFEDEIWKEYSARCIACGRCNTSCPTCTCFTVQDIPGSEENDAGDRRRIWSSCHVKNFSLLAGNHDFRNEYGDRMRYRTLHKIRDFKKRNGVQMCVGCGRCDDVCPEYISMFKAIEKLNQIVEARKHG